MNGTKFTLLINLSGGGLENIRKWTVVGPEGQVSARNRWGYFSSIPCIGQLLIYPRKKSQSLNEFIGCNGVNPVTLKEGYEGLHASLIVKMLWCFHPIGAVSQ